MQRTRTVVVGIGALAVVALAAVAGAGRAASASAPVNEAQPTITGSARQGETLVAQNGSWDQPISTYSYQWQRCSGSCSSISGATDQAYSIVQADVGRTLRVIVTARNSGGESGSASSAATKTVTGVNAPVNGGLPSISGTTRQGQTLTASHGSWSGSPSYTYQWRRCNSAGASCGNVGSASTSASYTLSSADVGHTMRVLVTATNAGGSGSALSSPTGVVVASGSAPANSRAPYLSGTAAVGRTLSLNVGSWKGSSPISFAYGWERCDTRGANCSRLAADGSSYVLSNEDANHTLRGIVTASNADGRSSAVTRQTALVQGPATATAVPTISGTAQQGKTLSATAGRWISSTKLTLYYQWVRCDSSGKSCAPITGASSSKYVVTSADVDHRLFVQVKGHNAYGDSFANSAQTGVVGGSASAAVSVTGLSLPDRLTVDRVSFSPARIQSRSRPLTLKAHVTTTGGRPVAGALVYAVGVPYDRLSKGKEVATDGNGWATISFRIEPTLRIRHGNRMVLFVRARKPKGDLLAGISTRRLVSVRVG
ncbi:MAG TPA: hypothetical protein VFI37_09780 [Gaiellaceae bacterium]|jgi:hypothetical protein|nr:hypothetical protein [Gaiellaceae bacterium]